MTEKKIKLVHRIYAIAVSVISVIAGLCLIAACLHIYSAGGHPYSRLAVAQHFSIIAVPVYLCLALVIGGFLLDFALPTEKQKSKPANQQAMLLRRLQERRDLSACDEGLRCTILKLRQGRKTRTIVGIALLVVGAVIFLSYALNPAHFHHSQINSSMIHAMFVLLPCLAVPFAWAVYAAYHTRGSVNKEIELWKQVPAADGKSVECAPKGDCKGLLAMRSVIILVAVVLLIYGFVSGGTADVLTKAINICTECVGLG